MDTAWSDPIYRQMAYLILGVLFCAGIILFPFRNRHSRLLSAWASLQSWLLAAPIIIFFLALKTPWPLAALTTASILGAKEFFQITGIYHKSSFVWITYIGIVCLALCINFKFANLYDIMPMMVLGLMCLVPIFVDEYKNMVQYMALSIFNFIFLGWGFLHLGLIQQWDHGSLVVIYVVLLTEFSDNIALAGTQLLGRKKLAEKITSRRTWEGFVAAAIFTAALAYLLRDLLPNPATPYWVVSTIVAVLVGGLGDLVLSVFRKDLGVKDRGAFILGRGTLLDLMDRIIFAAPTYYYAIVLLRRFRGEP